ncbi:hypothetical protein C8R42DRAFT_568408, partial [Lentinula raphanica]
MRIKPIEPAKYSGEKDEQKFHRFAKASALYVKDGRVPVHREVNIVSNFLEGQAYTFYHSLCGDNPEEWTLYKFFVAMYNYIFPVNYRMEQRRRLLTLSQKGRKVREHVRLFEELCNSVGIRDERQKVGFLWESFYPSIIAELYRKDLDPETSSLQEIIACAERIELIEDLGRRNTYSNRFNKSGNVAPSGGYTSSKPNDEERSTKIPGNNGSSSKPYPNPESKGHWSGVKGQSSNQKGRNTNGKATNSPRRILSDKEKNEYRAAGKCFECGETTHKARDCPKKTGVKGDPKRPNYPPGLTTHNMEFELLGDEKDPKVIELSVSKIDWFSDVEDTLFSSESESVSESEDEWSQADDPPPLADCSDESDDEFCYEWSAALSDSGYDSEDSEFDSEDSDECDSPERRIQCADILLDGEKSLASFAHHSWFHAIDEVHRLTAGIPYPRDDRKNEETWSSDRFVVQRILLDDGKEGFLILDAAHEEVEHTLRANVVENPDFRIVEWYAKQNQAGISVECSDRWGLHRSMGDAFKDHIEFELGRKREYPGDLLAVIPSNPNRIRRFIAFPAESAEDYIVRDRQLGFEFRVPLVRLRDRRFDLLRWICKQYARLYQRAFECPIWQNDITLLGDLFVHRPDIADGVEAIMVGGVQIPQGEYGALQRNAASVKDPGRKVARPLIIVVRINGQPVKALLDSGSLGDFISTKLADQLTLKKRELTRPLVLQLAVQGSRSKINWEVDVNFEYQKIQERRTFDIANIANCDMILGTKFLYQHEVTVGFNPCRVVIGSNHALPLEGPTITKVVSRVVGLGGDDLEAARNELRAYAKTLCRTMDQTDLPPLREINHKIPLIDDSLIIPWRPSRLPEKFREQWVEKRDAYIRSGRWKITTANNTVPLLLIPKPG